MKVGAAKYLLSCEKEDSSPKNYNYLKFTHDFLLLNTK